MNLLVHLGLWAMLGVLVVTGVVRGVLGSGTTVGFGTKSVTWIEFARTHPEVILHYLRLCLWPWPLCSITSGR